MEDTISVRRCKPADLDTIIAVFHSAVRRGAYRDYTAEQISAWCDIDRNHWQQRVITRRTWVALRLGEICGFATAEAEGYLDLLFTHADHQRTGVATQLLNRLETAMAVEGVSTIFTEASITAQPFFTRRGYQLIAPQRVKVRGQEFINYRMRKRLAAP